MRCVRAWCARRSGIRCWCSSRENKKITQDEAWGEFVDGIPFKRPQSPEDIGEAVAFLASDRARNITASAANVSGGQMIW